MLKNRKASPGHENHHETCMDFARTRVLVENLHTQVASALFVSAVTCGLLICRECIRYHSSAERNSAWPSASGTHPWTPTGHRRGSETADKRHRYEEGGLCFGVIQQVKNAKNQRTKKEFLNPRILRFIRMKSSIMI